jgi:hypothetical protein
MELGILENLNYNCSPEYLSMGDVLDARHTALSAWLDASHLRMSLKHDFRNWLLELAS